MSMVTGVVEWAGPNKFGGHSIKMDGRYFNSKFEIKCAKGDTVEFDSGETGKHCRSLRVVGSGGGGSTHTPGAPTATRPAPAFPLTKDCRERSIVRQNALARAIEICALNMEGLDDRDTLLVEAIRIAAELERFTAGDIDATLNAEAKAALTGTDG